MSNTLHKDYEVIQRFYDFELDDAELAGFNQRIEQDPVFAGRVDAYLRMEKKIDVQLEESHRAKISSWKKRLSSVQNRNKLTVWLRRYRWSIAAATFVTVGLSFWISYFNTSGKPQTAQQLALVYWDSAPRVAGVNSRSDTGSALDAVIQAIDKQQAEKALEILSANKWPDENPNKIALLEAEALIMRGSWQQALLLTQGVSDRPEHGFRDLALYYQAICYLYQEDISSAERRLTEIVERQYPTEKLAQELLLKLKN